MIREQEQGWGLDLGDFTWVFVGCGGTFYAASPYLAVLVKRYCTRPPILIDPGKIEEGNESRQWPGWSTGEPKVRCAAIALGGRDLTNRGLGWQGGLEAVARFKEVSALLDKETDGRPVLAIVNVDNNEARLDVADWLESRTSPGIMVVSGCEREFGQCYPGVWMNGEAVLDWREHHPDVIPGEVAEPVDQCNLQNVRANALTGVLVGMCIEDIADHVEHDDFVTLSEFYWECTDGRIKMWESRVNTREAA